MFGFGKRKSLYQGFLTVSVATCTSMKHELVWSDAISVSAFIAGFIHSSALNGGVKPEEAIPLADHMRVCALEVFGDTNSVSLAWSTGFGLALELWNAPDTPDRVLEFYRRRTDMLPWELGEHQYYHFTMTALSAVRETIKQHYRKWC